jgi:hypothetical protein
LDEKQQVVDLALQISLFQSLGFGAARDFGVTASRTPGLRNPERIGTVDLSRGKYFRHFIFGENRGEVSDFGD